MLFRRYLSGCRSQANRVRPQLEMLETRCCPSITVNGATMTINGDGHNDTITVTDNGQGQVVATLANSMGSSTVSASGINDLAFNGSTTSQDTISLKMSGALTSNLALMFCLDKGAAETTNLDFSKGIDGASLSIAAGAGSVADQYSAVFGSMTHATFNYKGCLGTANTSDQLSFNDPISNSRISINFAAGNGAAKQLGPTFGSVSQSSVNIISDLGTSNSTDQISFCMLNNSSVSLPGI